jgi:hypothetical protein
MDAPPPAAVAEHGRAERLPAWERSSIFILLIVSAALLGYQAWRTGVTVDEPAHLLSARLYWEGADVLRPGDMPPLIKIVSGWVPLLHGLPLPDDIGRPGEDRHEWEISLDMMGKLEWARLQPLFFRSRLPLIIFPLLTIVLVWWWARQLFTPLIGVLAAAIFALEPTALGHGALLKNDHASTFAYLLLWYALWRYWRAGTLRTVALTGLAVGLCLISKLTLLFALVLAPVLMLVGDVVQGRLRKRSLAYCGLVPAMAYLVTVAAVQFEVHTLSRLELWRIDSNANIPFLFATAARIFTVIPVPDRMWEGLLTLISGSIVKMPVYFFGEMHPAGHPLYFVGALLVKTPVGLIVLGAAAFPLLVRALLRRRLQWTDLAWVLPGPLYVLLASSVPYQMGIRLVLPALPFGILLAMFAVDRLRLSKPGRWAAAALLLLFAGEAVRIYPHGIAFFNVAAGGPSSGHRYLADSNLDWGQGLGDLELWARKNNALPVKLSYFGNDNMFRYFRDYEVDVIAPPWNAELAKGITRIRPEPGHYYAISPTLLPGYFFDPKYRDFYAEFRAMKPVARPGYSIFVYRVDSPTP